MRQKGVVSSLGEHTIAGWRGWLLTPIVDAVFSLIDYDVVSEQAAEVVIAHYALFSLPT
jgi:hypothetical protein